MSRAKPEKYVTALRFSWLTKAYDPIVKWTTRETKFKRMLTEIPGLTPGMKALDIGCGTGTLSLLLGSAYPEVNITGIDGDQRILEIAKRKLRGDKHSIQFEHGMAENLPYDDSSFDRIYSSLFFHHLNDQKKETVLREAHRVLRPGGEIHIADWGEASSIVMRILFIIVQLLDGFENTAANVKGEIPKIMAQTGFVDIYARKTIDTILGTICIYSAIKPDVERTG